MASNPSPLPQFVRYAGAGAIGTSVHYATLVALVQGDIARPVAGSTLGALAGAFVNYLLNYHVTFASQRAHRRTLPRFALIAGAGIALNALVMAAVQSFVAPHYIVSQIIATCAVLIAGFLANRAWTF